ncbi:hypothetical protein LguiA_000970 [Lonicera macranthoides]
MKDNYHLPIPQKEHPLANRLTKSIAEHTRKPRKINKKCLNYAFASVSEDVKLDSPNSLIDISSISEVSEDSQLCESAESFIMAMNPAISPASEIVNSNLTALPSTITADKEEGDGLVSLGASAEFDGPKLGSIEAEMVVKHLRQAQIQVLNLADGDLRFKKLLDALIKVVMEEFYCLPLKRGICLLN